MRGYSRHIGKDILNWWSVKGAFFAAILACLVSCGTSKESWDPKLEQVPDEKWYWSKFETYDTVTSLARIGTLRDTLVSDNHREVRIWLSYFGWPAELHRFLVTADSISGISYDYWPRDNDVPDDSISSEHMWAWLGPSCADHRFDEIWVVCSVVYKEVPDWSQLYWEMVDLGLWRLPDESALGDDRLGSDGWSITVELRNGNRYRTYYHWLPNSSPYPEAQRVNRIAKLIRTTYDLRVESERSK